MYLQAGPGKKLDLARNDFHFSRFYERQFQLRLHSVYNKNLQRSRNTNSWEPR
jgi:hypothetical protein